ncbi:Na+-transporting NADH:ubiquinone oxidoreductase subunit NqrB [Paenibacillus mucilaginosus]|uniref:hypothetical protein n=1 Tax=Paenibacillus mucilaginosus TaxID=61624 RepID=UPI003D223BF0
MMKSRTTKIVHILTLLVFVFMAFAPTAAFANTNAATNSGQLTNDIYNAPSEKQGTNNPGAQINNATNTILKVVGGIGASFFALMFMILALALAFGSLNPQKRSMAWTGIIVCGLATFIFFMAYSLPGILKSLSEIKST